MKILKIAGWLKSNLKLFVEFEEYQLLNIKVMNGVLTPVYTWRLLKNNELLHIAIDQENGCLSYIDVVSFHKPFETYINIDYPIVSKLDSMPVFDKGIWNEFKSYKDTIITIDQSFEIQKSDKCMRIVLLRENAVIGYIVSENLILEFNKENTIVGINIIQLRPEDNSKIDSYINA